MNKTVQNVKNSLKFKAQEKEGILSVKIGVKKFSLPVKARMISGDEYLFLSFPASSELYRVTSKDLDPMDKEEDATEAFNVLNTGKKRGRRRGGSVEMPDELAAALRAIPSGYKLGYNADGSPKLVRSRQRTKK
jgi:hypothetical protein